MLRTHGIVSLFLCLAVLLGNAVPALATRPVVPPPSSGPLSATMALTQTRLAQGGDGLTTLAVTITAARDAVAIPSGGASAGLDLVVVLDRSGSMRGPKLEGARQALLAIVDNLDQRDRLALVSYADAAVLHHPPSLATPGVKAALRRSILALTADGNTNLGAGLSLGLETLLGARRPGAARQVVLVSDGLANQGVTDALSLGTMAARGLEEGVTVSSVGVGLDFNQQLMTRLADQGGGVYRFLEDPAQFAAGFFEEFTTARRTVAAGIELRLPLPPGVHLVEASGYPVDLRDGSVAVVRAGNLVAGASRTVHCTLRFPVDRPAAWTLHNARLDYRYQDAPRSTAVPGVLEVACVASREEAAASLQQEVWEKKVLDDDFNKLKETVADKLAMGDEAGAAASVDAYAKEQRQANAAVNSTVVETHLEKDVEALKDQVGQVMAAPAPAKPGLQNKAAKTMQHEGYSGRRGK